MRQITTTLMLSLKSRGKISVVSKVGEGLSFEFRFLCPRTAFNGDGVKRLIPLASFHEQYLFSLSSDFQVGSLGLSIREPKGARKNAALRKITMQQACWRCGMEH